MMKLIALALLTTTGCFIEQLPDYKDDGSGTTGTTPAVKSLVVGSDTTCAVLMTGKVRCWGNAMVGLGGMYGNRTLRPVAIEALSGVEAMVNDGSHGCVLVAGVVSCFGGDDQGQVGNGTTTHDDVQLTPAIGATGVAQIDVASSKTGARKSDGSLLEWGAGPVSFGQAMPTAVAGAPTGTIDYSRGDDHDCAVVAGGTVQCWGWSTAGQLGRGTVPGTNQQTVEMPAPVINISDATQVIAGYTTCALHASGDVSCWGGGILNPATGTPTPIAGFSGVQHLAFGSMHICGLMSGGTVACMGNNMSGALGIGEGTQLSTTPVVVPGLTGIVEIAAGGQSTCARRNDGQVFCWGSNLPGDGSMMGSFVPVQVRW